MLAAFLSICLALGSLAAPLLQRDHTEIVYVDTVCVRDDRDAACGDGRLSLDVTIYNIADASQVVEDCGDGRPMWINSWNGDDYGGACIALWRNTVTVPVGGCGAELPVLCA